MTSAEIRARGNNKFVTSSGNKYHIKYTPKLMNDGTIKLIESGKDDIKASINSFHDVTDMAYVLRQLQLGDTSVLTSKMPMYGDFTKMPNNMHEAMQLMIDGERKFYELPLEVRQKFDNNFRKWMIDAGNEEWLSKMGIKIESPVVDQKEEVKSE